VVVEEVVEEVLEESLDFPNHLKLEQQWQEWEVEHPHPEDHPQEDQILEEDHPQDHHLVDSREK
jgi:hypothetical protein